MWEPHDMTGLGNTRLSGSGLPTWRLGDALDGSPTGCSYAEVHGRVWPLGGVGTEPAGGGGVAGDGGADIPPLVSPLRGGRRGGAAGSPDWQGVGQALARDRISSAQSCSGSSARASNVRTLSSENPGASRLAPPLERLQALASIGFLCIAIVAFPAAAPVLVVVLALIVVVVSPAAALVAFAAGLTALLAAFAMTLLAALPDVQATTSTQRSG